MKDKKHNYPPQGNPYPSDQYLAEKAAINDYNNNERTLFKDSSIDKFASIAYEAAYDKKMTELLEQEK